VGGLLGRNTKIERKNIQKRMGVLKNYRKNRHKDHFLLGKKSRGKRKKEISKRQEAEALFMEFLL
jgi:hypothetical protein